MELTNVQAIKKFFELTDTFAPGGGKRITIGELKGLSSDDKKELGALAAIELGATIKPVRL